MPAGARPFLRGCLFLLGVQAIGIDHVQKVSYVSLATSACIHSRAKRARILELAILTRQAAEEEVAPANFGEPAGCSSPQQVRPILQYGS